MMEVYAQKRNRYLLRNGWKCESSMKLIFLSFSLSLSFSVSLTLILPKIEFRVSDKSRYCVM